jgi:alpha-tubulin suppressor-like RCC1 family protein
MAPSSAGAQTVLASSAMAPLPTARRHGECGSCWGDNYQGQLGLGTSGSSALPAPVVGIGSAGGLSVGALHSCALRADSTVWCWGANAYGEIGDGTTGGMVWSPVRVVGLP